MSKTNKKHRARRGLRGKGRVRRERERERERERGREKKRKVKIVYELEPAKKKAEDGRSAKKEKASRRCG